ncbi:MarR family winged helix-turn-helix transcriptional regulator [Comamonas flocculans]|uniref:MarR family transcriptional regulator n=1 Tax=Comamonas flocculans TaxID=2597701 RepID=A0A5B8RX44_9BURK|nr:MarR family transcriptional regulator [Comamonas flocculans]QEA14131.1 MarR family transcriptional regulator [Comamonas flocculans]
MKRQVPRSQSPDSRSSSADEGVVDALVTASFVTMAAINRIGAEHDLSLSLVRVLGILWDRRPRMSELAEHLGLEKQTMSGLIARAQKRGLVARAPNADDRRAMEVFLTSEGAELVQRLRKQAHQALLPRIQKLCAEDQQQLQALLECMLADHGH